ncbi:hypothetical protein BDZ85DRAFT_319939 [Elsinoe ampelina]|uniref:Uncharacterized protein n=1 Tax=Elsinoe ampelina TaxID=302913 RepID=A0A6A6GAI0_9PEZI|nr:hypothetical protein BDZ85DRAFT_319939 [Elsinoe ampelina]
MSTSISDDDDWATRLSQEIVFEGTNDYAADMRAFLAEPFNPVSYPTTYQQALDMFAVDPMNTPNPFSMPDAPSYFGPSDPASETRVTPFAPSYNFSTLYDDHSNLLTNFRTATAEFIYTSKGTLIDRYSGSQINDFIYNRPPGRTLTAWVRRSPQAVSGRTPHGGLPECMCAECPQIRLHFHRREPNPINRGEYLIAFDELDRFRGDLNIDPYAISGYIHFYCLERFVGLHKLIMTIGDSLDNFHQPLQLDNRKYLPSEPNNGRWACAISDNDVAIIERFRQVCNDSGGQAPSDYPTAAEFSLPGGDHARSVLKCLHARKWEDLKTGDKRVAHRREVDGHLQHVHQGDLEVYVATRLRQMHRSDLITPRQRDLLYDAKKYWIGQKMEFQRADEAEAKRKEEAKKR